MKKREHITPELIVRIVQDRVGQNGNGEWLSYEELAEKYNKDKSQLARLVRRGFRDRLVRVEASPREPKRNRPLEVQLESRFPLRQAVVIDDSDLDPNSSPNYSDTVHARLGQAMGIGVLGAGERPGSNLRDGDCIGLGGGRAIFSVVESVRHLTFNASDITLRSLSGAAHARFYSPGTFPGRNVVLDADFHTLLLGPRFSHRVMLQLVSRPLACKSEPDWRVARSETALDPQRWDVPKKPDSAFVGVGSLGEGHEYVDAFGRENGTHILEPVRQELRDLNDSCANLRHPAWNPVCDIANRPFHCPIPDSVRQEHPDLAADYDRRSTQIDEAIRAMDSRLLTVTFQQLKGVPLYLVAGTVRKAGAISYILSKPEVHGLKVAYLSIDATTAEKVLEFTRQGPKGS